MYIYLGYRKHGYTDIGQLSDRYPLGSVSSILFSFPAACLLLSPFFFSLGRSVRLAHLEFTQGYVIYTHR